MIEHAKPCKIPPKGIFIGHIEGRLIVEESETLSEYMYYNSSWNRLSIQESFKCCGSTSRRQSANCILNKNILVVTGGLGHERCVSLVHIDVNYTTKSMECERLRSSVNQLKNIKSTRLKITKCRSRLPVQMCKHSITSISKNQVIVIGGWLKGGISNRVFLGQYFENQEDIHWTELSPLKHGSSSHVSFMLKNHLIVAGGWGSSFTRIDESYIYCIQTNTWSPGPKLPYPVSHASAIVHESKQFALIFGGLTNNGRLSRKIIIYTPENEFIVEDQSMEFNPFARELYSFRIM
jgi:hypothetical protein